MVHLGLEERQLGSGILELGPEELEVAVADLEDQVLGREIQDGMLLLRLFRREDWGGVVDIGGLDLVLLLLEAVVLGKEIGIWIVREIEETATETATENVIEKMLDRSPDSRVVALHHLREVVVDLGEVVGVVEAVEEIGSGVGNPGMLGGIGIEIVDIGTLGDH